MRLKSLLFLFAMLALIVGGCSDDDNPANPGTPTSTTYTGIMAGTGVSGTVSFVIPTAKRTAPALMAEGDTLIISGTLDLNGGSPVTLTGWLVVATGELWASGGGYTFTGTLADGRITGSFTYTGGNGLFACDEGTSSSIKSYCGRYQDDAPGTDAGAFNMTISGTTVYVIIYPDGDGSPGTTTGTYNTSTYAISITDPETHTVVIATGTLNPTANTVSGTFNSGDATGTWSGGLCN